MPSTVLGKRTRSAARAEDAKRNVTTRAKRREQFVILDEAEKENPFVTPKKAILQDDDPMDVDELAEEEQPLAKRGRKAGTTPAKHGAPASRLPLSPTKTSPSKAPEKIAFTPSTPRHRDAFASKVAVTPRHRLILAGRPPLTPRSPHTLGTPRHTAPTVYNEARQLFSRGSAPTVLFGREEEKKELQGFISTRTKNKKSGCIYVSGPPGTGKSAFVADICRTVATNGTVETGYINCMSVKNATDLYRTLLEEFVDITEVTEGTEMDTLNGLFMQRQTPYVVTLDEVDHLMELDIDLLYNIFEWSLQKTSSLVLVGIANALDFTDRFLPRLKARGLKPHLLPFLPYTAQQISSVITSKLKTLLPAGSSQLPFIHPTAIMFLSKKVAAQSGDLRKAFDICRRAIDLIEADTRDQHAKKAVEITPSPTPSPSKTPLVENNNLSSFALLRSPSKSKPQNALTTSLAQLTVDTAPRATIAHMAKITAAVFSNGTSQRLQNLNLQQKAVLCSLSAMEKKKRASAADNVLSTPSRSHNTAPTIKELFEAYTALCKRENILHPLTSTEFRDIVGSLETLSLISAVEGKAGSLVVAAGTPSRRGRGGFPGIVVEDRRVASVVGNQELGAALAGPGSGILRGILEGDE
ncbi:cell division control protein Cdc6 [Dothidotthia symphoricarpi CBS 119687]|uniref:Cell division control protein n=1 Tax=Dothidotthia symphoricarpi CBS 119687 TaxID=1392245 RepID=A0A6A6ATN9_9PLEO|nr:cell division control protein Cdc6 [Dothidotthia symphoricarpi CBS 119687]KAF2134324.1 cell division control protein Cdc6 [Dothidotthia symphoricarpi CBS 119687]